MVGQEIRQEGGNFIVQTGRSGGKVTLNPQQFQSFQSGLRNSFESGKNQSFKRDDTLVKRAISFGFAEGQRGQFESRVSSIQQQQQRTLGASDRAKIARGLKLSQTQQQQLRSTERGEVVKVRKLPPRQSRGIQSLQQIQTRQPEATPSALRKDIQSVKKFLTQVKTATLSAVESGNLRNKLARGNTLTEQEKIKLINAPNIRSEFNILFEDLVNPRTQKALDKLGVSEDNILRKEFEFDPSALVLGVALDPLIRVGVAQKTKVKVTPKTKQTQVTSGIRFDKLELDNIATGIRNNFLKGEKRDINELVRRALVRGDKKEIKFVKRLIEDSIGKKNTNQIFRDIVQQEGISLTKSPKIKLGQIDRPPTIKGSGTFTGGAGGTPTQRGEVPASTALPQGAEREFQPSLVGFNRNQIRVNQAQAKNQLRVELSQLSFKERKDFLQTDRAKTLIKQANTQVSGVKQISRQEQSLRQFSKQEQRFEQLLKSQQQTRQSQKFVLLTALQKAQLLKQQAKSRLKLRATFKKNLQKPKFLPPILKKKPRLKPFKKIPEKKPRVKRFQIVVFKKGKEKKVGIISSKKSARKLLKKRLETTLRASGFIFDRKKNKRIVPKITSGFRKSKTKPNVIVEKRNRRLDTRSEVKKIQSKRRKK